MNFIDFDNACRKCDVFSKRGTEKNEKIQVCYIHIFDFNSEIKIIANRILNESYHLEKYSKELAQLAGKSEGGKNERISKYALKSFNSLMELRVDIKSFYFLTRIFLDDLCVLIKYSYGKNGEMLPKHMSDLLENENSLIIDEHFFIGLRDKMKWFKDFKKERDAIVHKLATIVSTYTKDGKIGFQVLEPHVLIWGSETATSIDVFIEEKINNLTEILDFLSEKFEIP